MLQQAQMSILDTKICQQKIYKWPYGPLNITDKMVCARKPDSMDNDFHGDIGGPLVCQDNHGRFILHGVVSFGSPRCSNPNSYSVFTRVTEYAEWIERHVQL